MNKDIGVLSILNVVAMFIFVIITFIGSIGIFGNLGNHSEVNNETISYACLFIVGTFGLIVELLIVNLKSLKR